MRCAICQRPDVEAINAAMRTKSNRQVASDFGLSKDSVRRHKPHISDVAQVAPVVRLASSQKVAHPKPVEGLDLRLLRGQVLPAVVQRIGEIEAEISESKAGLGTPGLGLREQHLVLRTLVMQRESVRKYLELAIKSGALDAPDADRPEASTVEDVEREVAALVAELEAARG